MVYGKTPEECILNLINENRGIHTLIGKGHLRLLLKDYNCVFAENATKHEMAKILGDKVGYRKLEVITHVGLPSVEFQRKFNINNNQVKKLARDGLLHVTGRDVFRLYGKYRYADIYSVYDYFELKEEDVRAHIGGKCKMKCIYAVKTDQYHGWECGISGSACMYLVPNQDACASEYGEAEHTEEWKQEHNESII